MTKIAWKPGTMLSPVPPVMVTCGTMDKPNVLTVAWTGIINSEPPLTYISVRPSRYSHDIIKEAGEFVINIATYELAKACDYCGVKSGKNTDKFKDMGLEIEPCTKVKAPMLVKAPISLECKVIGVTSYQTHDMFTAEIVNVNIDDKYLEEDGRLALEKAGLLAYVHGRYYTLGRDLGAFGFSVDKSKENKTKPRKSKFAELLKAEAEAAKLLNDKKPSRPPFKKKSSAPAHSKRLFYKAEDGSDSSRTRKFDGRRKFDKARRAETKGEAARSFRPRRQSVKSAPRPKQK